MYTIVLPSILQFFTIQDTRYTMLLHQHIGIHLLLIQCSELFSIVENLSDTTKWTAHRMVCAKRMRKVRSTRM